MTKKNTFEDDALIDQQDPGGFYYGNMFRFPEEDMTRPIPYQKPMPKKGVSPKAPPEMPGMMDDDMQPPMGSGMQNDTGVQMPAQAPPMMQPFPDEQALLAPTLTNIGYTQAYLRTLIGKRVRVSFLIGTSLLVDRVGTLLEVGISYIVLRQLDANINVMADLYSIKFVDIYNSPSASL